MCEKLQVGTVVKVRNDLVTGEIYYNEDKTDFEVFIEEMKDTRGREYIVLKIEESGYILNSTGCIYTYDMLEFE